MAQKNFPNGLRVYSPRAGAPSFLICNIAIDVRDLHLWLDNNADAEGKIRLDVKLSKEGKMYAEKNDYRKPPQPLNNPNDILTPKKEIMYPADEINPADIPF